MSNFIQDPTYPAAGRHLLANLGGCSAAILNDRALLQTIVMQAAAATNATVLEIVAHQFTPQGVTIVAVLGESHASLHTYPEHGAAFWDCFTCGDQCQPEASLAVLVGALHATNVHSQLIDRTINEVTQTAPSTLA
ncbi:adenosylmethionine decarboxylase [Herpetosiphon llansteffanensis]|uniref:adenosylmethionine decarboxylase n=1 Tax=Herpetosiphon llansteffanensis TaxID=2094568 RepID=UPI000D7C78BE|nr:adenosylmethionine decarboxylase [Herpetosiphon llansteffanensis]